MNITIIVIKFEFTLLLIPKREKTLYKGGNNTDLVKDLRWFERWVYEFPKKHSGEFDWFSELNNLFRERADWVQYVFL